MQFYVQTGETVKIAVRIPSQLVKEIDSMLKGAHEKSRSQFVQHALEKWYRQQSINRPGTVARIRKL